MKRLLLVLAVLAVSLSLVGAIDVKKTVEGPTLLDFGERLKVTVTIDTGTERVRLGSLTDPIPDGFTADMTSSSCSQSASEVTCDFGSPVVNGTYVVGYSLVAVKPVEKVYIKKAVLQYAQLDSPLSLQRSSNQVGEFYTVGPPMLNVSHAISADGTITKKLEVLPNSKIKLDFLLQNTGAIDAGNVSLSIRTPNGWSATAAVTGTEPFTIASGDSKLMSVGLSGPPIGNFSSSVSEISATVTWSGGNRTYSPVEIRIPLKQIRPDIIAGRQAGVRWKLMGRTLEPFFSSTLELKNAGDAKATVRVVQDAPQGVSNVRFDPPGSWSAIELAGGKTARLAVSGSVDGGVAKLILPATLIAYSDAKGNAYEYSMPSDVGALELKVSKGVLESIFDATSQLYPWLQFLAAALVFVSAWGVRNPGRGNKHLMLAFCAVGMVALLIVISALKVILL